MANADNSVIKVAQPRPRLPWLSVFVVLFTATLVYVLFVEAAPPRSIEFAAGAKDGQYYHFANQYAKELKRHGIAVHVRETLGSAENLELLSDPSGTVSVALVQGGMADAELHADLRALGSLYREPLWVFLRRDLEATRLGQLAGLRIAVGKKGSGTRQVAVQLLEACGVGPDQASLIEAAGNEAADRLEQGSIDAACFVASVDAGYVQRLGRSPEVRLMNIEEQEALTRRFRELSAVTVPAGLLDLAHEVPAENTALVAPAALLVVRSTLHPALASVLLEAARRVHARGDALSAPGEFPSTHYVDLPLSEDAEHYYRYGPPFLQRVLPFWLASFVDRIKLLALPLIVLAMPLVRATPPLLRWRIRRRVYVWYARLRELDHLASQGISVSEARLRLAKLKELESQIARVETPLSYMEEYYHLRVHIDLVHRSLLDIVQAEEGTH
jgi:TRAP transporter TAXI family solute receptor